MEIVKWSFAIYMIVIPLLWSETAGYGEARIRKQFQDLEDDIHYMKKDITKLFEKTNQMNISRMEDCGINTSGSNNLAVKYYSLITAFITEKRINRDLQDQLQSMEGIIFDISKNITYMNTAREMMDNETDRELRSRLRSMEDIISASESRLQSVENTVSSTARKLRNKISLVKKANDRVANEKDRALQSRFQSVENTISANEKVAQEIYGELQSRLRSLEVSVEGTITDIYRELRENMTSFMTMITDRMDKILPKAETSSVKPGFTTFPIINSICTTVPESGVYTLYLQLIMSPVTLYCDQDTDGGGWIVFMRRQDGSVNFFRPWLDYKVGFGSPGGEFWAGNELLYHLTKERPLQLRIDMEDYDGNTAFAMYREFQVGAEEDKYRLYVHGYSGDAGDSLIDTYYSRHKLTGMQFSTFDSDNDKYFHECAKVSEGGWWYNNCFAANLNGPYSHNKNITWAKGIIWESWTGYGKPLKRVEMKIR